MLLLSAPGCSHPCVSIPVNPEVNWVFPKRFEQPVSEELSAGGKIPDEKSSLIRNTAILQG